MILIFVSAALLQYFQCRNMYQSMYKTAWWDSNYVYIVKGQPARPYSSFDRIDQYYWALISLLILVVIMLSPYAQIKEFFEQHYRIPIGYQGRRRIQLYYQLEAGQIKWIRTFLTHDWLWDLDKIIGNLENCAEFTMELWLTLNKNRIQVRPYDILQYLLEIKKNQKQERIREIAQRQRLRNMSRDLKRLNQKQIRQGYLSKSQRFQKDQLQKFEKGDFECIICLELIEKKGEKMHQLVCGHIYHYACIRRFCVRVRNQCPTCRYRPRK